MSDEEFRTCVDLCFYRFEKAAEDLKTARNNFVSEDYRAANNRAYYSIFHSLRSVLAVDRFDSKKHSGIIAEFRRKYIKNRIFPVEISGMIDSAFEIRNSSDYNDMFIADKNETKKQIENAEYILKEVGEYIGFPIVNKFLYYTLMNQSDYLYRNVRKASIPRLSREVIEKTTILLPAEEKQREIVDVMDRFDRLCNDISDGLPAEIEARRKQYEFYRDRLLTFKEME